MESLYNLFEIENSFNLLLAPPGWGKTRLLLNLYGNQFNKIIFISPLRALAEEFSKAIGKSVLFVNKASERAELYKKFASKSSCCCLVTTPELIDSSFYDLIKVQDKTLVVMDEFHLFYYWGTTFRPVLFESFMGVAASASHVLALSATFGNDMRDAFCKDISATTLDCHIINLGNQRLKNNPKIISHYNNWGPWPKLLRYRFISSVKRRKGTILFFCKYRAEVDFWVSYLKKKKIYALGCKGGEVQDFITKIDYDNPPDCIIATSTLSHGVNLPQIREIFIGYKTNNKDFWIQIVGRGGRRGESFRVHTLDPFNVTKLKFIKSTLISLLFNIHLAIYYSLTL